MVPPPTPNRPLKAPARLATTARRTSLDDIAGHTRRVPAPTAETLAESLAPLTRDPSAAGIFLDVDGTLAPIVERAEDAGVPPETARLLGEIARRYGTVACISGRSASEARRLVGVREIAYVGSHGAELIQPGDTDATVLPEFAEWAAPIHRFAAEREDRSLGIRTEDKGPIVAFHWRGAADEDAARMRLEALATAAEAEGFGIHWGRKVLEVRPPVAFDKGRALTDLLQRSGVHSALYAGDDATDLDAFAALDALAAAVRVGVASDEGPTAIVERADLVVDGPEGLRAVLAALAEA